MNACPDHACSAYAHPGALPLCADGVCVVTAQTSGFVLVVSPPEDAFFAPGRTFAIPFKSLSDGQSPACSLPDCARLPPVGFVSGSYIMNPNVWQGGDWVRWNLGNPGTPTVLPVLATYRPLWGASGDDAASLGLPLDPVRAEAFVAFAGRKGPAGGPDIAFHTYLAPGPYLRTLVPDPPFDRAFPPEIQVVTVTAGQRTFDADAVSGFETTTDPGNQKTLPTFDISRGAGLDSWNAYLRDATTKQVVSTVVPLSGIKTTHVVLATNHVPFKPDALCNAELVLAPPSGAQAATGVFRAIGGMFPTVQTYPPLPAWANVHGTISTYDGAPVEADLVFEATGITVLSALAAVADAGSDSGSGADAGQGKLPTNDTNFEYVGRTSARLDPKTGTAGYSVDLPPGQYMLAVRPLNKSAALTSISFAVDPQADPLASRDLHVDLPRPLRGNAAVADGRPLAGAIVEAIPVQCYAGSSPWCMPREAQATTASDGSFGGLELDPGRYLLRVRPADGTRLPWVVVPSFPPVAPAGAGPPLPVEAATVVVPVPVSAGLTLLDPGNNAVVRAIVRVFTMPVPAMQPPAGQCVPPMTEMANPVPAVEVGRAITDATGHYELYLAPPSQ